MTGRPGSDRGRARDIPIRRRDPEDRSPMPGGMHPLVAVPTASRQDDARAPTAPSRRRAHPGAAATVEASPPGTRGSPSSQGCQPNGPVEPVRLPPRKNLTNAIRWALTTESSLDISPDRCATRLTSSSPRTSRTSRTWSCASPSRQYVAPDAGPPRRSDAQARVGVVSHSFLHVSSDG